jgi:hypothetical protein
MQMMYIEVHNTTAHSSLLWNTAAQVGHPQLRRGVYVTQLRVDEPQLPLMWCAVNNGQRPGECVTCGHVLLASRPPEQPPLPWP